MNKYKVYISSYRTVTVDAHTANGAKEQAWKSMAGGYKYGWKSKAEFKREVKVKRIG